MATKLVIYVSSSERLWFHSGQIQWSVWWMAHIRRGELSNGQELFAGQNFKNALNEPDQTTLLMPCQPDWMVRIFGLGYLNSSQPTPKNPSQPRDVEARRADTGEELQMAEQGSAAMLEMPNWPLVSVFLHFFVILLFLCFFYYFPCAPARKKQPKRKRHEHHNHQLLEMTRLAYDPRKDT